MRTIASAALAAAVVAVVLTGCAAATGASGSPSPTSSAPGSTAPGSTPPSSTAPSSTAPGGGAGQSIGGSWQLVNGADSRGEITPGAATITLVFAGTQAHGDGGCNAFGATASSSVTGPLTIRLGIHTDMACAQGSLNATESRYFAALGTITEAAIAGDQLTLTGGTDTLVFMRDAG
jgi:heat shock protein HslJ